MVKENADRVFSCCGKYIVCTKAVKNNKIVCPSCGKEQIAPLRTPKVIIFKKN